MNTLAKQIESLTNELMQQVPVTVLEIFEKSITALKSENIETKIAEIGDQLVPFSLPNAAKELIYSKNILEKGKMILAFFRGSWCPYCNLELRALQENLAKITHKNVTLLAVSPQSTDHNTQLIEKHLLTFDVLTDKDNLLAHQLGIRFELQEFALPTYEAMGINLEEFNQNNDNTLPVPAIFVVDCDGSICYKFADADYRNRLDIDALLHVL
jgi:peroxiredoxin